MKYFLFSAICIVLGIEAQLQTPCVNGMAGNFPCKNVDLLALVPNAELGGCDNTNDVWGWVSPNTGKEYALVGCSNGTAFLDVSDPVNPVYLGILPAYDVNNLWRDIETFHNYLFVVSESSNHGLQIMNLLQLDDVTSGPIVFQEDAHYAGFGHCHTLNIDLESGVLCAFGTNTFNGGPHLVDINDPLNPTLMGGYANSGYTHDGFITTYTGPDLDHLNQLIVVCCNGPSGIVIVNASNSSDIVLIDEFSYPQVAYCHQGWFTQDNRYFLVDDELDEINFSLTTRTHIFDFFDLDNIAYMGFHQSDNSSIDHNLYVLDQFVFESNYRSGVRLMNAVDIESGQLNELGYFDLFPLNDLPQFSGTWSNYPYLPSGINLATSMYDGLFILQPNFLRWDTPVLKRCKSIVGEQQLIVNGALHYPLHVSCECPSWYSYSGPSALTNPGTYSYTYNIASNAVPGIYDLVWHFTTNAGKIYTVHQSLEVEDLNGPASSVLLSPNSGELISSGPVNFSWSPVPFATYYIWTCATDPSFSQNIQSITTVDPFVQVSSLVPGTHYWKVQGVNDCGKGIQAEGLMHYQNVGIPEDVTINSLSLYPQPAGDFVHITSSDVRSGGNLQLYTIQGQQLPLPFMVRIDQENIEINTTQLSTGIYLLRIGDQYVRLEILH